MTPTYKTRLEFWRDLPKGLVIAELGVFRADHAMQIWALAEPTALYLVDQWRGLHTCCDSEYRNPCTIDLDAYYESDIQVLKDVPGLYVDRSEACEWLSQTRLRNIDVVYLDSDHDYAHISREIELALNRIPTGGWVCGHDYNATHFRGVVRAVDELRAKYPDAEFRLSGETLASWFLRIPA